MPPPQAFCFKLHSNILGVGTTVNVNLKVTCENTIRTYTTVIDLDIPANEHGRDRRPGCLNQILLAESLPYSDWSTALSLSLSPELSFLGSSRSLPLAVKGTDRVPAWLGENMARRRYDPCMNRMFVPLDRPYVSSCLLVPSIGSSTRNPSEALSIDHQQGILW